MSVRMLRREAMQQRTCRSTNDHHRRRRHWVARPAVSCCKRLCILGPHGAIEMCYYYYYYSRLHKLTPFWAILRTCLPPLCVESNNHEAITYINTSSVVFSVPAGWVIVGPLRHCCRERETQQAGSMLGRPYWRALGDRPSRAEPSRVMRLRWLTQPSVADAAPFDWV